MSKGVEEVFDWVLKRRRCPFCVEPFPVLKCSGFEAWNCPKCGNDFCLDDEGDLEPIFREGTYAPRNHFPKALSSPSSFSSSHSILCSVCSENQQKIVTLLQSFEESKTNKEYELYAVKLNSRYPLCSTCSFRASARMREQEEMAELKARRNTVLVGGSWQNKLKLAEQMRFGQIKRKLVKGLYFWPDFLFQLFLTFNCVFKLQEDAEFSGYSADTAVRSYNIAVWLPDSLKMSSVYFVLSLSMFLVQFNGIASNGRSFFELAPQFCLLAARVLLANFLYRPSSSGIDLNSALTLTAISLAVIFKIGSRNSQEKKSAPTRNASNFIFANSTAAFPNTDQLVENNENNQIFFNKDKNGFASYSDTQHKYHSFVNAGVDKPIMPWSEKPLPGKLSSPKLDENHFMNLSNWTPGNNKLNQNYRMRPTRLVSDDPLELEPMFSSFSLSDEPQASKGNRRSTTTRSTIITPQSIQVKQPKMNQQSIFKPAPSVRYSIATRDMFSIFYNSLLTAILAGCRVYLRNQAPLVTIVLALTFGLRGFLWPRLDLKVQLCTLSVAVCRLIWLGAVVNGKFGEDRFVYCAMALDLILIILR